MTERSINEYNDDDDGSHFPVISLFLRISREQIREEQRKRKKAIKYTLICLFVYILIFILFLEIDNDIYNVLKGPFYMNSNRFIEHIKYHNKQINFLNRNLFLFYEKYFQIELGENNIQKYGKHPFLQLIIEPTINKNLSPNKLYVKFATEEQEYYHTRLPFNFQLFSTKTLKCIVHQMKISSNDYNTWSEKSIYIQKIESFYNNNSSLFNKNVLIKCGILIGYLYNPRGENNLLEKDPSLSNFDLYDVAIDASSSYSLTYFILGFILLIGILTKLVLDLSLFIYYYYVPIKLNIHSNIKKQFEIVGINSFGSLKDLLYESVLNDLNYRFHMFIIEYRYLIIFNIDLNECNAYKLSLFYNESPFIIIPISSIVEVRDMDFTIGDENDLKSIHFLSISDDINEIEVRGWLHDKLMEISPSYKNRYVEIIRNETEEEIYNRRFAVLVDREESIQFNKIANNIDRMMGIVKSASVHFIAKFCLIKHPIVQSNQTDVLDNQCSVCLDEFRVGQKYAHWPCQAQHYFHCDCMLRVLRESNKCPLCRHAVESTPSFFQNFFNQIFLRI